MTQILIKEILEKTDIGESVAESDSGLEKNFVVTEVFRNLLNNKCDIIRGEKGTGKTAIYKHLATNFKQYHELQGVEILPAFNLQGNSIFHFLRETSPLDEDQYRYIWGLYIFSLIGNSILNHHSGMFDGNIQKLDYLLSKSSLRVHNSTAALVFNNTVEWIKANAIIKEIGTDVSVTQQGVPVVTPNIKFGSQNNPSEILPSISEFLATLNDVLKEKRLKIWVAFDRLDESFQGQKDVERLVLRSLIRTYLDLLEYDHIRLKLFVRNDLFVKIIYPSFVNLTHVNARTKVINWNENDLFEMICHRFRQNQELLRDIGFYRPLNSDIFRLFFPEKTNGNSKTWNWMGGYLCDGNNIKTPRNLIDLIRFAINQQLNRESYNTRIFNFKNPYEKPLLESQSLIAGGIELSKMRIEDTLFAENGEDTRRVIKMFRNGKSTYSEKAIEKLLGGIDSNALNLYIQHLCDIGFLQKNGGGYKVPKIYRGGLNITQGQAPEE